MRISFINRIVILFLLAVPLLHTRYLHAQAHTNTISKPNIIFILMDDLGYGDLGAFFQNERKKNGDKSEPWLFTPQLDKMAAEGAMLPHQYCAAPVCAPSRASFLLGVSQGHSNVRDNQFDKALENNYTLASMLKEVGYSTAAIGKWGLQGTSSQPTTAPAHPLKRGFDYFFGYISHTDGHEHYPKEGVYRGRKSVWENDKDITEQLDKCYTGDLFTAVAKKYIIEHTQNSTTPHPFFLYLAYDTPHSAFELPTQAYPKGNGLHGGIKWLGTPGKMINTASGKVDSYLYPEYASATYDHDKNPNTPEIPWPEVYKRFASVNHRIDDQIGDLLQLLKDLKIDKNTIVVFTSDNGPTKKSYLPKTYGTYEANFFNTFGPFDGIKRDCYEGGVRTPTIAWWPGTIPAGNVVSTPSISYDWMPTFAEIAGTLSPIRSDGVSLLPSLTGKGTQKPGSVYVEYFHHELMPSYEEFIEERRKKTRGQMQMLRKGDTVAVRYNIQSANDDFEIYNVVKDPQQTINLALHNPDLQQYFKDRVLQIRKPDTSAPRPYDAAAIAGVNRNSFRPGLKVCEYHTSTTWIPQAESLLPIQQSVQKKFVVNTPKGNLQILEGYLYIPKEGKYTFHLSANGKAFLKIHHISLIDADYSFTPNKEKTATITLKEGYHPIQLYYMKVENVAPSLSLTWSYANRVKEAIPSQLLFH